MGHTFHFQSTFHPSRNAPLDILPVTECSTRHFSRHGILHSSFFQYQYYGTHISFSIESYGTHISFSIESIGTLIYQPYGTHISFSIESIGTLIYKPYRTHISFSIETRKDFCTTWCWNFCGTDFGPLDLIFIGVSFLFTRIHSLTHKLTDE